MSTQPELRCQIVPVEIGNLLIPDQLIEDVVSLEEVENQKNMLWRNRVVPIITNDNFNKTTTRVAIIKTVMGYAEVPFLAIPTDGIPYAISVSETSLGEVADDMKVCAIAAGYAKVGSLDCMIVDFPKLEGKLRAARSHPEGAQL